MPFPKSPGFTLIELLVAMAIFAVISALAFGGLNAVVTQSALAQEQIERLGKLQRTIGLLTDDFAQLNPRYVRDVLGQSSEPPLVTDTLSENIVRLSRSGWRNPVPVARGTLQRVQYRIEDEALIREYWLVMDYPLGMEPRSATMLEGVVEIEIEYLDDESEWQPQWPPLRQSAGSAFVYPRAVRITLDTENWGEIVRVVDLLE
jgi:general secretion pathway protein J